MQAAAVDLRLGSSKSATLLYPVARQLQSSDDLPVLDLNGKGGQEGLGTPDALQQQEQPKPQ